MNKECGTMVLFLLIILIMISVYWRPMWGILRGLLLGFLFLIGGSSLNIPVPVSFVVFVLYCQLGTPCFARQTTGRQKRQEHFTNRQPPTRITPRTPRSSTIMPMRWTARIIPTCIASIRTIRSCMRKPKAQNVKFSTIRKSRRRCSARKISQKITTRYGFSGS